MPTGKTSEDGITLIKGFEGFRGDVYDDVGGKKTIGYGHLLKNGENYTSIDEKTAEALLKLDLADAESCVNKLVTTGVSQNEFDSLVSFVYNLGCTNFSTSTLLKFVNLREFRGASNEFKRWDHAGGKEVAGILRRRLAEASYFSNGDLGQAQSIWNYSSH